MFVEARDVHVGDEIRMSGARMKVSKIRWHRGVGAEFFDAEDRPRKIVPFRNPVLVYKK